MCQLFTVLLVSLNTDNLSTKRFSSHMLKFIFSPEAPGLQLSSIGQDKCGELITQDAACVDARCVWACLYDTQAVTQPLCAQPLRLRTLAHCLAAPASAIALLTGANEKLSCPGMQKV